MYQLRITSGPHAGRIVQLVPGQPCLIGRGTEAHLSIPDDKTLSRVHAEVVEQGGGWVLRNKSQHGTLLSGEVVHGDQPLAPGASFQAGGTHVTFEAAPAGAAAMGTAQPGGAAGGPPPSGTGSARPAGGDASPAPGADFGAAGKDAAAKLGAAAAALGEGAAPVRLENPGPGFPYGDLVKGGLTVVKANLMPSLALFVPHLFGALFLYIPALVLPTAMSEAILPLMAVGGLIMLFAAFVGPQMMLNYMEGVKQFQETGQRFGIGQLLRPTNIVQRYLTLIVVGLPSACCFLIGLLLCMAVPIIVDKPNVGFMNAVKGGLAFGKKNFVPLLILGIVLGIVQSLGSLACGVGILVTAPLVQAAFWLAYEMKREEIEQAAAESGVQLA